MDTGPVADLAIDSSSPDAEDDVGSQEPETYQIVILTVDGTDEYLPWVTALESLGYGVDVSKEFAESEPTLDELGELEERYEVAMVVDAGAAQAYSTSVWNQLGLGVVINQGSLMGSAQWGWLNVGDSMPTRRSYDRLRAVESHSVLYGLEVGNMAELAIFGETHELEGFLRETDGTTELGAAPLQADIEELADSIEPLLLWEPGPFDSDSEASAAHRRAFFGLVEPVSEGAAGALLKEVIRWASMPGEPIRPDASFDPVGLLLTWQSDPTTTMTLDWHTLAEQADRTRLRYRAEASREFTEVEADSFAFPFSDRIVHRVELEMLAPDTLYVFDFGPDSDVYRFRTMPSELTRPLHFVTGGDIRHTRAMMLQTSLHARRHSPAFLTWAGDHSYADGRPERVDNWYEWFDVIKEALVSQDGVVIPILAGIGNHEVLNGYFASHDDYEQTDEWRATIAPYYYSLFAFPGQPGYAVLDFGDYMSWILLDTDHSNPLEGAQTEWLASTLMARQEVTHIFPMYHFPAYPSNRRVRGRARSIRTNWLPLFEASGVRTAFEAHDHTYKRTVPIRNEEVDEDNGIVFLGDGAWGVRTRVPRTAQEEWYIAESLEARHFIVGTISEDSQVFRAFDEDGRLFDTVTR